MDMLRTVRMTTMSPQDEGVLERGLRGDGAHEVSCHEHLEPQEDAGAKHLDDDRDDLEHAVHGFLHSCIPAPRGWG